MNNTGYQTDLTGAQFELIKPCLRIQRQSKWPLIHIINAILYVCDQGIKWRALPKDFPAPWQTVYWYFCKWTRGGSWQSINEQLVMIRRATSGATPLPTALVIDSQSVKNSPTATAHTGTDGGKLIKGRKRLMLTDGQGNLLMARVFPANRHDGPAALRWWQEALSNYPLLENVRIIWADQHFGGVFKKGVEASEDIQVVVSKERVNTTAQQTMPVHKRRWVVERTIAWEGGSRRLCRDYERLPEHSEAFLLISSISRILRNPLCPN